MTWRDARHKGPQGPSQGRQPGREAQGGRGASQGRPATAARPVYPPLPPLPPVPPRNPLEKALKLAGASLDRFADAAALAAFLAAGGFRGQRGSDRRSPVALWLAAQPGLAGATVYVTAGIAEARKDGVQGLCVLPLCAYRLEIAFDAGMHHELDCQPGTSRKRDLSGYERAAPGVTEKRPAAAPARKNAGAGGPAASQPLLPGLGTPAPAPHTKDERGGR